MEFWLITMAHGSRQITKTPAINIHSANWMAMQDKQKVLPFALKITESQYKEYP